MGMSADAYLFYGFVVDEDENFSVPDEWDGGWESFYEENFNPNYTKWSKDFTSEQSKEYWKQQQDFQKAVNVEIHHTQYDCFMLYIKESMVTAYWMEGTEVKSLEVKPEWEAQLKDFCDKMKIPYQEPKWRLCADYS